MPIYFEFVLNVTLSYHGNNRKVNEKKKSSTCTSHFMHYITCVQYF